MIYNTERAAFSVLHKLKLTGKSGLSKASIIPRLDHPPDDSRQRNLSKPPTRMLYQIQEGRGKWRAIQKASAPVCRPHSASVSALNASHGITALL
jgi:hypothetical protein